MQADFDISRISKAFTPNAAATSFKLSWYQYLNNVSTGSQRAIGQLSTGSALTPGTGTGGFFRFGTVNTADWGYIYSNGTTQTVSTTTAIAAGWHKLTMTVIPGAAGTGTVKFTIDNGAVVNLNTSAIAVTVPNVVTFGNNVTNGAQAGAPDTTAWFDSVMLEQFAPAASSASIVSPADGATGVDALATTLNWTPGASNVSSQDVLFGTDPTLTAAGDTVLSGTAKTTSTFNPGELAPLTTYYWEVVEKNVLGDPTAATIWSFTTGAVPEPTSLGLLATGALLGMRRRRNA